MLSLVEHETKFYNLGAGFLVSRGSNPNSLVVVVTYRGGSRISGKGGAYV